MSPKILVLNSPKSFAKRKIQRVSAHRPCSYSFSGLALDSQGLRGIGCPSGSQPLPAAMRTGTCHFEIKAAPEHVAGLNHSNLHCFERIQAF
jgi:hypothetical protein